MSSAQFSVYIPRIFINIPNSKIISTFENLELGTVQNMDIVYRTGVDGSTYKMAFIHFSYWFSSSAAINLRDKIEDPTVEAKLVYDDPWHWLVLPNKSSNSRQHKTASRVDLNSCFNRISSMADQLSDVYNELFIKNNQNSSLDCIDDIESGDLNRTSTFGLDIPHRYTPYKGVKIHPHDSYYDEQMSVSSDGFDDLEVGCSPDSHTILITDKEFCLKKWITENVCGNA